MRSSTSSGKAVDGSVAHTLHRDRRSRPGGLAASTLQLDLEKACANNVLLPDLVVLAVQTIARSSKHEGFVFGQQRKRALATTLFRMHRGWTHAQRGQFLVLLATAPLSGPLEGTVDAAVAAWRAGQLSANSLRSRLVTVTEHFCRFVSSLRHGSAWLIRLRGELRELLSLSRRRLAQRAMSAVSGSGAGAGDGSAVASSAFSGGGGGGDLGDAASVVLSSPQPRLLLGQLRELDAAMREMFSTQQGMQLRRIVAPEPALRQYLVEKEAVHAVRGEEDIERRLHGQDRYCYGLFHPGMRTKPLAFVYGTGCGQYTRDLAHTQPCVLLLCQVHRAQRDDVLRCGLHLAW